MKLVCAADLHGQLPTSMPPGDVLLLAGDLCPNFWCGDPVRPDIARQMEWLATDFKQWLDKQPYNGVVAIAGNHDFVCEGWRSAPLGFNAAYLCDSYEVIYGGERFADPHWTVWGSPWHHSTLSDRWAFNCTEDELAKKWASIPEDTNILLVHTPPQGYGDQSPYPAPDGEHCGSPSLTARIRELYKLGNLKVVVCGHVHEDAGVFDLDGCPIINCSLVNGKYEMVNLPVTVNL